MTKNEMESLVRNFEHGLKLMESDSNIKTCGINNMTIYKEALGYYITITNNKIERK